MNLKVSRSIRFHSLTLGVGIAPLLVPINRNLEYEYSLSLSVFLVFISILINFQNSFSAKHHFKFSYVFSGFLCLMAPAVLWRASNICECSPREILIWWIILVIPAWFLSLGIALSRDRINTKPLGMQRAIRLITIVIFIIYPLIELWVMPQKRTTSLIYGVLHGPIYDTWIPIDLGIIFKRSLHSIIGILLISWSYQPDRYDKVQKLILTAVIIAGLMLNFYPSQGHGFSALKKFLPDTLSQPGISMHYRSSDDKVIEERYKLTFLQAEFHLKDLAPFFDTPTHVDLFVYENKDKKKLLFGGGGTDVTDVFTPSVHINLTKWPHPTLRHELVHALGSKNGFHGLGFHPNMAFTEGLAVALAPQERALSLSASVSDLHKLKKLPKLSHLFSPMFWTVSGARAYYTAGSFIQFLGKKFGYHKVIQLYNGNDWDKLFPSQRSEITNHWLNYLEALQISEDTSFYSEALFRYPGVFKDTCPHSKATLKQTPSKPIFPSWRRPNSWSYIDFSKWRSEIEPQNPLAKYRYIYARARDAVRKNNISLVQNIKNSINIKINEIKYLEDFWLLLLKSDLTYWLHEDDTKHLNQLSQFQSNHFLGYANQRQTTIRQEMSKISNSRTLRLYLAGFNSWRSVKQIDHWIYRYLKVKSKLANSNKNLTSISKNGVPPELDRNIVFEFHRSLAQKLVDQQNWQLALKHIKLAQNYAPDGSQEALQVWVREIDFYNSTPKTGITPSSAP